MLLRLNRYFLFIAVLALISFHLKAQQGSDENGFVQYFWPNNNQVSSEGTMRDGKPDGYWKTFYVTGVIKSEGKRTNFLLDSTWNFHNQAGELTQQINYKLGEKSGYATSFTYKSPSNPGQATVISSELYVNGKKEGNSFYYFSTGELKYIVYYKNGKKQGLSREFSTDSTLIAVEEYNDNYLVNKERLNRTDKEGRKQGTYREYYDNGRTKKEEHYLDDQLHGYYREFDGRGELLTAMRYERGMIMEEIDEDMKELLDMKSTFDADGKLIFTGGYIEGVPVGIHRFFDTTGTVENSYLYNEMGQKISEGIIDEQGRRKGTWLDFFPTGETRAKGQYVDNQRSGSWSYFFLTGGVEQKGRFERDRYRGTWTWYYSNGNVWREEAYFNGREDGIFVEYDLAGNILTKGDYISGEKEGEWIYQVGDHTEKGNYVIGLREGLWTYFYNSGTVKYEGNYYQGNADKRHKYYYPSGVLKEEQYYVMGIREKNWKKYDEEGNLTVTITYRNNVELRINGFKIKLPDEDVTLIR